MGATYQYNPFSGKLDLTLSLTNPLQFQGAISVASDFPTPAAVQQGWFYTISAPVTDNDSSKTNTGQSFIAGDEIAWDGVSAWALLGNAKDVTWADIGGTQTDVEVGNFSNSIGYLTYYSTISNAEYASSAGSANYATSASSADYASSAGYASSADYVNSLSGHNVSELYNDAGYVTTDSFASFISGTPYTPTSIAELEDGLGTYFRVWNLGNGNISEWSNGTWTYKIGATGSSSYLSGTNDFMAEMDGTYVQNLEGGVLIPQRLSVVRSGENTIETAQIVERQTTGVAAAGIGLAQQLKVENDAGTSKVAVQIETALATATDSSEDATYTIKVLSGGSLVEKVKVDKANSTFSNNVKTNGTKKKITPLTDTGNATSADDVIVCNKGTAMTVNLPAATGSGQKFTIKNIGAGTVTVDGDGSETIDGATTQPITQWSSMELIDYGSGVWAII